MISCSIACPCSESPLSRPCICDSFCFSIMTRRCVSALSNDPWPHGGTTGVLICDTKLSKVSDLLSPHIFSPYGSQLPTTKERIKNCYCNLARPLVYAHWVLLSLATVQFDLTRGRFSLINPCIVYIYCLGVALSLPSIICVLDHRIYAVDTSTTAARNVNQKTNNIRYFWSQSPDEGMESRNSNGIGCWVSSQN